MQTKCFNRAEYAESLESKIRYVKENPVREGLVARAEDYKWLWQE